MNKKGFTLVEMMAVIVLVGLLAVIAVATYTNVNESAKRKTLESKKEEIRTSAMKWARENNITNKTIISVNALVVEGYLTADENKMGEIGKIENPVTGENMICNTVDIFFKEGEMVADVNDTVQNCDLATQSLIDEKIQIKVIDENNVNKTGSKSMSNWTNKNVIVVVSSDEYDKNAVSISFDFEGNTKTKMVSGLTQYTDSIYINKTTAEKYYNVFNINGNLLLNNNVVVTYALNDGTVKSRSYTIRIDKEEATAVIKSNNEWLTTDKDLYVLVDDGKGSGAKGFIISTDDSCNNVVVNKDQVSYDGTPVNLDIGKYYIWTIDNAGNKSFKPKVIFEVNNVDRTVPWCDVEFVGTPGDHGWFKENPVTPYGRNDADHLAGLSGFNLGVNQSQNSPEYTAYAEYDTFNRGAGELRDRNTVKAGELYWCHVKTLAGNYANNSRRLYLDMDAPTINISISNPDVHTKTKDATISLYDALSGLNASTEVRLGFSQSATGGPTTWETVTITAPEQTNQVISKTVTVGSSLTGTWYLWIDTSSFTDYAGNYAVPTGMADGKNFVYGPYKFDNTPPQCTSNNGKTYWTTGSWLITQYCGDAAGTTDQSGCSQPSWDSFYSAVTSIWSDSLTISDKAGNTTVCPFNIYLDNDNPTCNGNDGKSNWTKGSWTGHQYCYDGYSGCTQNPYTNSWSSSIDQTTFTIYDNMGHSNTCGYSVRLDTEAPTCSGTVNGNDTTGGVSFTVSCSDTGGSGCASGYGTFGTWTPKYGSEDHKYTVKDAAGNVGSTCGIHVWGQLQERQLYCSNENRCEAAGCETAKTCTCTGTKTVSTGCTDNSPCTVNGSMWGNGTSSTCYCYAYYDYSCTNESVCGCETYKASCPSCGCGGAKNTLLRDWADNNFCDAKDLDGCTRAECRWVYRGVILRI